MKNQARRNRIVKIIKIVWMNKNRIKANRLFSILFYRQTLPEVKDRSNLLKNSLNNLDLLNHLAKIKKNR
jgi:hypothetical protein